VEEQYASRGDFAANARLLGIAAIAVIIGGLSTVAAFVLLHLISFFTNLFYFGKLSFQAVSPATSHLGLWGIAVPAVGGLIVGLMARYGTPAIRGHGIPEAIEAILFRKSKMSPKVAVLKPVSSAIVIGSGGPFGAEGPIIMTGGAVGSLLAQCFHLSAAERKTLLVAGAVAGMTAVFNTPIAAVLLAVELLLFEMRPRSLLPVAVACAVAAFARPLIIGSGVLFPLQTPALGMDGLLWCVVAGVAAGMLSWIMSAALYGFEDLFHKLPIHWMWWPAIGGVVVGIGGLIEPRALGVGYDVIGDLLTSHPAVSFIVGLMIVKFLIWAIALGSGTSGGVLAPLFMIGAALGALVAPYMPGHDPQLWPLLFMAATLGGMMRAPIMAVVFAFELTHDMNAFAPILLASAASYGFTVLFMRRSILTEKIARRGHHIYYETGIDPLERHFVDEVMTTEPVTIDAALTVDLAVEAYFGRTQQHRAYPVVRGSKFVGMADRDLVLKAARTKAARTMGELFGKDLAPVVLMSDTLKRVSTRFAVQGIERLAVVDDAKHRHLMGIVSRSDLVKPSLKTFEEEERREVFAPFISKAGRVSEVAVQSERVTVE
jgi:H+/Cl- antiporter ClcA